MGALVMRVVDAGRHPPVTFAAGGIAIPADAPLMRCLGGVGKVGADHPETIADGFIRAISHLVALGRLARLGRDAGSGKIRQANDSLDDEGGLWHGGV